MPSLETLTETVARNRVGQNMAAAGAGVLLLSVAQDISAAPSWHALLTPMAVGGILLHLVSAWLLYKGGKQQDPTT